MNVVEWIGKAGTAEGEFVLPSQEKVKGFLVRDENNPHSVSLMVTPPGHWGYPPDDLLTKTAIHGIVSNRHLTVIGTAAQRMKTVPALSYYEVKCQRLLSAHTYQVPDDYAVTKVKFKTSGSRSIFPLVLKGPKDAEQRDRILRAIAAELGEELVLNEHEFSFDRVYYCADVPEIVSCDTHYGRVYVRPYDMKEVPYIDVEWHIDMKTDSDLSDAESATECVLRFLWLITGQRQVACDIRVDVIDQQGSSHNLDVNFLLQESPLLSKGFSQTISGKILIDPIHYRKEFENCLSSWSRLSPEKRIACDVMLSGIDKSILPPFRIAHQACAYEWYNESGQNQYLKDKILARLDIIESHLPKNLTREKLEFLINEAKNARNQYVHVVSSLLSKTPFMNTVAYAKTLEFVFLSSVLVECGWDMKSRILKHECRDRYLDYADGLINLFESYIFDFDEFYEICNQTR